MTESLALGELSAFDGLWCAPGSPYRSLEGELARNVLGIPDAHHAEYDPDAAELVIQPLSCSLVGRTTGVRLDPASRAAASYGRLDVTSAIRAASG